MIAQIYKTITRQIGFAVIMTTFAILSLNRLDILTGFNNSSLTWIALGLNVILWVILCIPVNNQSSCSRLNRTGNMQTRVDLKQLVNAFFVIFVGTLFVCFLPVESVFKTVCLMFAIFNLINFIISAIILIFK